MASQSNLPVLKASFEPRPLRTRLRNWPPTMSRAECLASVTGAFRLWQRASLLRFRQLAVDEPTPADIELSFQRGRHGDDYPFDGRGRVLAHAFSPGSGIGGDVHLDADEHWLPVDADPDSFPDTSTTRHQRSVDGHRPPVLPTLIR